jgi:hypothetical protein
MYLGTYTFDGDPDELLARYDRMMAGFPEESLLVQVCVRGTNGITVIDTCPSEAEFRAFSTSPEFHAALGAVGRRGALRAHARGTGPDRLTPADAARAGGHAPARAAMSSRACS